MTKDRLIEIQRLVERNSGTFSADVDPWKLVAELVEGQKRLATFLQDVREPIAALADALEEAGYR